MKRFLTIKAEFDDDKLDWEGPRPDNLIAAYNEFYENNPHEAFEIALKDENFNVISARIE